MERDVDQLTAALILLSGSAEGVQEPDAGAVEELERRGLARQCDLPHGEYELTDAGHRAVREGLDEELRTRRELLSDVELERFHQLLWDCALDIDGETRRRRGKGVKWILHEHFMIDTRTTTGPHNKVRRDALTRLEDIGAIEQVGGGAAKRTGVCWVVNPAHVQYPW